MPEYEHVTVEDLPDAPSPTRHKREIDEAVGATEFGFNVYVADPGEQLPWGYHHHPDHESTEEDGRSVVVLTCAACGTETLRFGEGPD